MNVTQQGNGNVTVKGMPVEWLTRTPFRGTPEIVTVCITQDTAVVLRDLLDAWDDARIREEQSS